MISGASVTDTTICITTDRCSGRGIPTLWWGTCEGWCWCAHMEPLHRLRNEHDMRRQAYTVRVIPGDRVTPGGRVIPGHHAIPVKLG